MAVQVEKAISVPYDGESECYICLENNGFSDKNPAISHTNAHESHKYVCHQDCFDKTKDRVRCACGTMFGSAPNFSDLTKALGGATGRLIGRITGEVIGSGIQRASDVMSLIVSGEAREEENTEDGWISSSIEFGGNVGKFVGEVALLPLSRAVYEFESAQGEFAKKVIVVGSIAGCALTYCITNSMLNGDSQPNLAQLVVFNVIKDTGIAIGACIAGAVSRYFHW